MVVVIKGSIAMLEKNVKMRKIIRNITTLQPAIKQLIQAKFTNGC